IVMSDSKDSTVTYMEVSSPFEDLSDIGSPGVDGLPMMLEDPYVEAALQALPYTDYIPGPEHPHSPVYQPLPAAVLPTAESPGYIADSDLEEDEEDLEEDPEEDPDDYPADRGDDNDDDDELSNDNEEEEEEHLAPADSVPSPVHRVTARMSIRAQTPISLPPRADVERLFALPTPPPSPLTPLSSPLPQIPSLPLPAPSTSHPLPLPPPLGTPPSGTPPLLPIPVPTSSPPLLLPSTNRRVDRPEVCLPPQKRMFISLGPRYEIGESSSASTARPTRGFRADYGFLPLWIGRLGEIQRKMLVIGLPTLGMRWLRSCRRYRLPMWQS
ncbi:hypothetical protein Tco_0767824, partial [Tanacetum coccineum]